MADQLPVIRNLELNPDILEGEVAPAADEAVEVEIDDPDADPVDVYMAQQEQTEDLRGAVLHADNLAEYIADQEGGADILLSFGQDLCDAVKSDKETRSEWEDTFVKGLRLMGIKGGKECDDDAYEELFEGASDVVNPLITEACIQFQSEALKAMLPPKGPVDTVVMGEETPERLAQARRVRDFMNYLTKDRIKDFFEEHDRLLAYLGKSGSAFKKYTWNPVTQRIEVLFLPAEQVIVPYNATSLTRAPRITHRETITADTLQHRIASGLYRDVELEPDAPGDAPDSVKDALDNQEGVTPPVLPVQDEYTIDEIHLDTIVPLFEDDRGGLTAPYIVHVDSDSGIVLAIYRNWTAGDMLYERQDYFVHYVLVQSDGFYGYGFIHLLGQLSRASTAALRQLLDAGTLSNMQGGFKRAGTRMANDGEPLGAGEFRDVEYMGERLSDAIMPLNFKEPSATLYQLMGGLVESGRRMVSLTDLNVGDGNQEAPVGTTIALLERGMNVMSAVHMRLCRAQGQEFKIIARLTKDHLPPEYPYDVPGAERQVMRTDFDERVDVVPVCDPRQFSQAQRITRAQNKLQLATQAPQLFNTREAYRDMLSEIDDSSVDRLLPPEAEAKPVDPMTENADALLGKPLKAFIQQNHEAHIAAHQAQLENPRFREQAQLRQALQAHIQEHMAFQYQVEMMQAMGVQSPEQLQQIPPEQLAVQVAQATAQVTGRAQAVAKAEAEANQPTIEQQALLQDLENKRNETQRKAVRDQMDYANEQRDRELEREVEAAKLAQDDRHAEMSTASQMYRYAQEEKQAEVDNFMALVDALRQSNQQEQVRDNRTNIV